MNTGIDNCAGLEAACKEKQEACERLTEELSKSKHQILFSVNCCCCV